MESSFWQYKVYAGIRIGSLERRHQTTVWSGASCARAARSHPDVYRCLRNKSAGSSDVGFGVIDVGVDHYGDRKQLSCKEVHC